MKACRRCRGLTDEAHCPYCGSDDLSRDWTGYFVVLNPEKSELAQKAGITKPGKFALSVR